MYVSFSSDLLQAFVLRSKMQEQIHLNIHLCLIFPVGSLYYCHQLNRHLFGGNLYSFFILSVMAQEKSVQNRKSYFMRVQFDMIFPCTPWYATSLRGTFFKILQPETLKNSFLASHLYLFIRK
jgi:hypothetical protein